MLARGAPDHVEERLLLVAQGAVEGVERTAYRFNSGEDGLEALLDGRQTGEWGHRHLARARRLPEYPWPCPPRPAARSARSAVRELDAPCAEFAKSANRESPGFSNPLREPPVTVSPPSFAGGRWLLRKRVEARLLLVGQSVVKLLQCGSHDPHRVEHRLYALLHRFEPADRRQ